MQAAQRTQRARNSSSGTAPGGRTKSGLGARSAVGATASPVSGNAAVPAPARPPKMKCRRACDSALPPDGSNASIAASGRKVTALLAHSSWQERHRMQSSWRVTRKSSTSMAPIGQTSAHSAQPPQAPLTRRRTSGRNEASASRLPAGQT